MAKLYENLFAMWISPTSDLCRETLADDPQIEYTNSYSVKPGENFENSLTQGFPAPFSPIASFACGCGYLTDHARSYEAVNYGINTNAESDAGRLNSLYIERFSIEGLKGKQTKGNGLYVMSTFFRNNKPVYLNNDKWAIWFDSVDSKWNLTNALNFHPSLETYTYQLKTDKEDPSEGIFENEDKSQTAYGPNVVSEKVLVNIPPQDYKADIRKIASCRTHTLFLDTNDNVYACGRNQLNQLGNELDDSVNIPRKIASDVVDVVVSDNRSFIHKMNGSVFVSGDNDNGAGAIDLNVSNSKVDNVNGYSYKSNFGEIPTFTKIQNETETDVITEVKTSKNFTYLLKNVTIDNIRRQVLFSCGSNTHGQLALDHFNIDADMGLSQTLVLSDSVDNEILFDVGDQHAMYVRQGKLHGVGNSEKYQIGATNENGSFSDAPYLVTAFNDLVVKKVECGSNFTMALLEDDSLWSTGDNSFGQCGLENTVNIIQGFTQIATDVKDVSVGNNHCLVLMQSGKLMSAGNNEYGQCATEVGFAKRNREDLLHSNRGFTTCVRNGEQILENVKYIKAEGDSSFIVIDEKVYASGFNLNGNLGIGTSANINAVTEIAPLG